MRIALVHMRHARMGGTELVLNQVARYLAQQGHEVTIVCRSHEGPPHADVRFVVLRSTAPGSALRMWRFARDVERHVRDSDYELVFGLGKTWSQDVLRTGGGSHQTYVEVARRVSGKTWSRRLGTHWLRDRLAVAIERRAFAPGAYIRVIANSQMVKEDVMRRYDVPEDRIELVYNGVDLERFHPRNKKQRQQTRERFGLEEHHFVLLMVGKGFGRKGLSRLLDALPEVRAEHPDVRLVVVGEDSSQRSFEHQAAELGVEHAIRFVGRQVEVEACYGAADLCVLPTHYDSFAFSVAEALATGVPVITTRRAGASELVDPEVCGEVLPGSATPAELARGLSDWCDLERVRAAESAAREASMRCDLEESLAATERILVRAAQRARLVRP